jgi:CDP-6-deoxy-D-xylo-4-hexulose-3-dehydrase
MRFDWPLINDNITPEDKEALVEFIKTPNVRFTNGPKVKEFEKKWSEWLGVKHSVFVNSGASANYIMASIVKEMRGSGEIIVPPIGWVSDVAPILNLGMTPVFVDVDYKNMSITVENIKKATTSETKAIILVHTLGFNAINDELIDFAKENNILLVEDACESHGTTYNNKKVGTFGDMSNFSFYFGHHITTIEGGMVCTNSDEIYEYIKLFRSHGMTRETSEAFKQKYVEKYPDLNPLFTFAVPGYNMRNAEMNAVLGIEQLKRLDFCIEKRTENLKTWLSNLDSKRFFVDFDVEGSSNFALPLILNKKDKVLFHKICEILYTNKVEFRVGTAGGGNQTRQPYLKEGKYDYRIFQELEKADHIHFYGLYVGNHPEINEEQIINLCSQLNA